MKLFELSEMISDVCPVEGINSNGIIFYTPAATQAERDTADRLMQENLPLLDAGAIL